MMPPDKESKALHDLFEENLDGAVELKVITTSWDPMNFHSPPACEDYFRRAPNLFPVLI